MLKIVRSKKNAGQSTVELILTLFIFFTILFMIVQVALSFGVANYFQYATFISSRALLSSRVDLQAQVGAAKRVLLKTVKKDERDRFSSIAKGSGDGDLPGARIGPSRYVTLGENAAAGSAWPSGARTNSWEQGVAYKFKTKIYMLPIAKGSKRGSANELELESESWLGRDPSEQECREQLEKKQKNRIFLYDNGC